MNIKLSSMPALVLAEYFAGVIHGQMVEMHLRATADVDGMDHFWSAEPRRSRSFGEVQAAIRSIAPGYEREGFIRQVKWHLDRECLAKGTDRNWQQYRAKVVAYHEQQRRAA